jgi:hypothetical protein
LLDIEQLKLTIRGWFTTLEVTHNKQTNEFHPHIHAVLYVPQSYFGLGNPKFIRQSEWIQLRQESARLDYAPSVYICRAYKTRLEGFSRLTKYLVKGTEFVQMGTEPWNILVGQLLDRSSSWRLVAFSGVLKETLAFQNNHHSFRNLAMPITFKKISIAAFSASAPLSRSSSASLLSSSAG